MDSATAVSSQAACAQCAFGKLCFPAMLPASFRALFPLVEERRIRLARGEYLFRAGEPHTGIHAIKAGFLKTCMPLPDGQQKIVGFHATGDALGLNALGSGEHATDAIALNGCEVCIIPLDKFEKLLEHPTESVHVRQLLARELARVEAHAATIGTLSAKQRVAAFLLDMSASWEDRGYSKSAFVLFMSRNDIGNFLGLTFETVSRTLSYFQSRDWITVHGKNMLIRDMTALQAQLAHPI
jgi:CRP/FNR family transcriptional regulator